MVSEEYKKRTGVYKVQTFGTTQLHILRDSFGALASLFGPNDISDRSL